MDGLSLCIQGTFKAYLMGQFVNRFIPVHTGNIHTVEIKLLICPVYPCAYREHNNFIFQAPQNCGLSLCIQGTYHLMQFFDTLNRFIPVHTGNIRSKFFASSICSVYPCAYREHSDRKNFIKWKNGLSLCIQGTSSTGYCFSLFYRFIPVHTGNIPIITYCFIIKILTAKFLPIF